MTTITLPELNDGERYAGLVLNAEGVPTHHLILLPGDEAATFKKAQAFAEQAGGELPTRQEQALLYANCKDQFKADWYWSSEQHATNSGYAWMQHFSDGLQYCNRKDGTHRARAVRRLPL